MVAKGPLPPGDPNAVDAGTVVSRKCEDRNETYDKTVARLPADAICIGLWSSGPDYQARPAYGDGEQVL